MTLYLIESGAPAVMVKKRNGVMTRIASYCLDHSMVFETNELLEKSADEYHFIARDGREYFFPAGEVRVLR